jgi:hypothetical protein
MKLKLGTLKRLLSEAVQDDGDRGKVGSMDNDQLIIPEYIYDVLQDMTVIKGAKLFDMVEAGIRADGKVPSEEEWSIMVDAMSDELTDLDMEKVYPHVTSVLADLLLP